MTTQQTPDYLWQLLEAQADDMFALYQLVQLLSEARDVDELVQLGLHQLMRVSDSTGGALFVQVGPESRLDLVALITDDPAIENGVPERRPRFLESASAARWFEDTAGLTEADCLYLPLHVGHTLPGLLALAAPSRDGFNQHQRHLIATMTRELARFLQIALVRSDLEREQRQVEQMQSDFVAAVSHELRTPLAVAQAGLDSLLHLRLTPEQRRSSLQDLSVSIAQLSRLVDTVLSFSRVDEGHWAVRRRRTNLAEIVREAVHECGPGARRLSLDVPHITVSADPDQLVEVVVNLCTNALKYSPQDSPVMVRGRASSAGTVGRLVVCDQGHGIPAEDQSQLFQKFFRARNVRETSSTGTGLGLYITKKLVEAQGGTIRLRSRVGRGTVVRVCLPLA
jgi:signal transduction histidine kinase